LVSPIWLPVFFLLFYNEPELGVGINPGMDLTPLPSSIGRGSNPTSDREPSSPPLDLQLSIFIRILRILKPDRAEHLDTCGI